MLNISVITLLKTCLEKLLKIVDITNLIDWPLNNTFSGSMNYGLEGELLLENVFIVNLYMIIFLISKRFEMCDQISL